VGLLAAGIARKSVFSREKSRMKRMGEGQAQTVQALELVESHKLWQVLGEGAEARLEASGVCATEDAFYVIFDNRPEIARIGRGADGMRESSWLGARGADEGHEDICWDERTGHFYVLIEALAGKDGEWAAVVDEYDAQFNRVERRWVDFPLEHENKGFEGIAYVYPRGQEGHAGYLLLLCEGNFCRGGKKGRTPGGGRVHVFRKGKKRWKHVTEIKLPAWLPFEDYAAVKVQGEYVAVASQASAMVWVTRVRDAPGAEGPGAEGPVAFEEGVLFGFPRDAAGRVVFCNVEGITWGGPRLIVAVSDRMKAGEQDPCCAEHDQAIQVFRVPHVEGEPRKTGETGRGRSV
jgi:hypothetical protein